MKVHAPRKNTAGRDLRYPVRRSGELEEEFDAAEELVQVYIHVKNMFKQKFQKN